MVDVVESVRVMEANEDAFIDRWRTFVKDVNWRLAKQHRGVVVKSLGD